MVYSIEDTLREHGKRYPHMEAQDIYTLLHQSALGSAHAILSDHHARLNFNRELRSLGRAEIYGPFDVIGQNGGAIFRVHLRKYLQDKMDTDDLFRAFVATANGFKGDLEHLEENLLKSLKICRTKDLPVRYRDMKAYANAQAKKEYPDVHHSAAYIAAYRPAYRVIAREFMPDRLAIRLE